MTAVLTPRLSEGSGLGLLHSAMTVPYAAGMRLDTIELATGTPSRSGALPVTTPSREPVLTVRLRRSLADRAIVVRGSVGTTQLSPVVFAPYSLAGTLLPIFRPVLAAGADGAGPFTVNVSVFDVAGAGAYDPSPVVGPAAGRLDHPNAAEWIEGALVQGRFARMLLLATLEKQRAIRVARQIDAARHLDLARFHALDARGRSLGVPRRTDVDETDDRYRARLAIYARWHLPTPASWADALNGPGADIDSNRALPSKAGVTDRFRIVEETNPLSFTTKLVNVGSAGPAALDRVHDHLRSALLFDIRSEGDEHVAVSQREMRREMRRALRTMSVDGTDAECRYLAPLAAKTLARAARLVDAAGDRLALERAYDPSGGSRHELGLGARIGRLSDARLRAVADALPALASRDDDVGRLAARLTPRPISDDPLGRWLFEGCGLRTVHQVSVSSIYVSPLPMFGQWIDGPDHLEHHQRATYDARYRPSDATGLQVRAAAADTATPVELEAAGLQAPPTRLTPTALHERLEKLASAGVTTPPSVLDRAASDGIIAGDASTVAEYLLRVINLDQVVAYPVPIAEVTTWGAPVAVSDRLLRWTAALRNAGFFTARAVWDDANAELLVLASVSQLPGADPVIGQPPPTTYYWYSAQLSTAVKDQPAPVAMLQSRGGRATVEGRVPGVALLVSIGYERIGLADPFEVRVELNDPTTVLTADQYGYLMNLLEAICPIGIEVNTFDIRRGHVDADGDGVPEFLTSRASRTYHRDRWRRAFDDRERYRS